jgi:hypothetical protein
MMKQGRALGLGKQQLDFREAQHANIMSFAGQDGREISRAPSMVSEAQSQITSRVALHVYELYTNSSFAQI